MEINGKKVINGQRGFTLSITKRDIVKGKHKDPGGCAAALALMRENKDINGVRVHIGRIFVEAPNAWIRYKTPSSLRDEIIAFDRGGEFLPGDHQVKCLKKSEQAYIDNKEWRKIGPRDRSDELSKDRRKKRVSHIVPGVRARGVNR